MIKPEDRHRVGKARLLRRQGKTYDEIRSVIGPASKDLLATWLRDIPRPPETNRTGTAKPELRAMARRLRAEGLTIGEIAEATGASKGSISPWIRDIRIPDRVAGLREARIHKMRGKGARAMHDRAMRRQAETHLAARTWVGELTDRELILVGAALYWAEGTKDKPWRRLGNVTLLNSDPTVLRVFLRWLDAVGVAPDRRKYRLSIHESADVAAHEHWWSDQLGFSLGAFNRATLKRHIPKPTRHNRDESYHGCLIITVARSRSLYDQIEGLWRGIGDAAK